MTTNRRLDGGCSNTAACDVARARTEAPALTAPERDGEL
jgi:hypothetical protein